jgi:hypothetical protein
MARSLALASALTLVLALALVAQAQGYPWLFVGAYATYEGWFTTLGYNVSLTLRLEVAWFNETHAQILVVGEAKSKILNITVTRTGWFNLEDKTASVPGFELEGVYDSGDCVVYRFKYVEVKWLKGWVELYVDKSVYWPVKVRMGSDTFKKAVELGLAETNIPGLGG